MVLRQRLVLPALILAVIATMLAIAPAARATDPTVEVTQTLVVSGNEVTSQTLPAGQGTTMLIRYACAGTSDPCKKAKISLPIPDGVATGDVGGSADIASVDVVGSQRIVVMKNSLPAGTTGSFTVALSMPAWITADNSSFTWRASMSADNATAVNSGYLTLTGRSAGVTHAEAANIAGRGAGDVSTYNVSGCVNAGSDPAFGPLGVQSGSQLIVTLPLGAVPVSTFGGDYAPGNPGTVTYALNTVSGGCTNKRLQLEYPTSNPANVVGATRTLTVNWVGRKIGTALNGQLGTASDSHTLITRTPTGSFSKNIGTPRTSGGVRSAAVGDEVSYSLPMANSGTQTWDAFSIGDTIPDLLAVTKLSAANTTSDPVDLWIRTEYGEDGVNGNGDDATLFKVGTASPNDVTEVDVAGILPSGDYVIAIEVTGGETYPGAGVTAGITARVLPVSRSSVTSVAGTTFTNTAQFEITAGQATVPFTRQADGVVDQPQPVVTVRHSGGNVPIGSRETSYTLSGDVAGDDITNPVFVVELPAGVTLKEYTPIVGLDDETLTTVPNWNGSGSTLLRWTFPAGTIADKGSGSKNYSLNYTVTLHRSIFTPRTVKGWISHESPTTGTQCGDNWFDGSQDAGDRDGDGNTTEVLCPWFQNLSFPTASSAVLIQSVKGSWDPGYEDGPASGNTNPGSADNYQLHLDSQATMNLEDIAIIDLLPRAGDTAVASGAARNPSSKTFPVHLRARPVTPALGSAVTTYYTTVTNPCRAELNYSPSGCQAPNWVDWDSVAPGSLTAVTGLKFDFGSNLLAPGDRWTVTTPVTTPSSGGTEPDYAVVNPDAADPDNDEVSFNSSGFILSRSDLGVPLLPSEAQAVGLRMPSIHGPAGPRPTASPRTTSGVGTAPHTTTVSIPNLGSVSLMDGLTPVSSLAVPGVGSYSIDPGTGVITFQPLLGFQGQAPAVGYRRTDVWGQSAVSQYTATVTPPAGPTAGGKASTGTGTDAQEAPVTAPPGGTLTLIDPDTGLAVSTITIPGTGTYSVTSGALRFVPIPGYVGSPAPVVYEVTDVYGQFARSTYAVTVVAPGQPPAVNGKTTSGPGVPQTFSVTVPDGNTIVLVDENGNVATSVTVPGEGVYTLEPQTGTITFEPEPGFTGTGTGVRYRLTDAYGQSADARYTPTVVAAEPPLTLAPAPATCTSRRVMTVNFKVPAGNRVRTLAVMMNGKAYKRLRPDARRVSVNMRGLAKTKVTVKVTARTKAGRTLTATRTYQTCKQRVTGKPLATLRLLPVKAR